VAEGRIKAGSVELGRLPVGYYEVWRGRGGATNRLSIGVLEGLARAGRRSVSPIGIDVAMAWFFPKETMEAGICARWPA